MPAIPAFGWLRQDDFEFEPSLGYPVSLRPCFQKPPTGRGVAQVVKCPPNKHKTPNSNPSTAKRKRRNQQ
jgi:hypothetical protein